MKTLALLVLAGASCTVFASEQGALEGSQQQPKVEQYTYAMDLDIARVVARTPTSHECGVVPAQMTYEDHQGVLHTIEYREMGDGCSNDG